MKNLDNIKISKNIKKLIGGVILVDSLMVGIFVMGNHTPIILDDSKIYLTKETYKVNDEIKNKKNIYSNNSFNNYIIYYKKPFLVDGKTVREVVKIYETGTKDTNKEVYLEECDSLDLDEYTESFIYEKDMNNYITIKQSVKDEIKDDLVLLGLLSLASTVIYTVGKGVITRDEKVLKK